MAEISRPWGGTSPGDAGPYSAEQWRAIYKSFAGWGGTSEGSWGVFPNSWQGVYDAQFGPLGVYTLSAGREVKVSSGSALVNGVWYDNTLTRTMTLATNSSGNPRIDAIVLRWHNTQQRVYLEVLQGTPASTPTRPTLSSATAIKDFPLAYIEVANNFASVDKSKITDVRRYASGAGLDIQMFYNHSASEIKAGRGVALDLSSQNRSIKLATSGQDCIGVALGDISNSGGLGFVCTDGAVPLYVSGAVARGDYLGIGSNGEFVSNSTFGFGRALYGSAAGTFVMAFIKQGAPQLASWTLWDNATNSNSDTTWRDISPNHSITLSISTGKVLVGLSFYANDGIYDGRVIYNSNVINTTVMAQAQNIFAASISGGGYLTTDFRSSLNISSLVTSLRPDSYTFKFQTRKINMTTASAVRAYVTELP